MGTTNRSNYPSLLHNPSGPSSYGSVNGNYTSNIEPSVMEGVSVEGKMSMSRRFFTLLTVFDVLFTFLIWIICTVVSIQVFLKIFFCTNDLIISIE